MKTTGKILACVFGVVVIGDIVVSAVRKEQPHSSYASNETPLERRQRAAAETEHTMLMKGMEVTVRAQDTDLHFDYALCGKSFLTQMQSIAAPLKDMGFRRLTCVDALGVNYTIAI